MFPSSDDVLLKDIQALEIAGRVRASIVPLARLLRQQVGGRLTPTQSSVLGSVNRHGPISMSDLAVREQLSPPMITKVVCVLEGERFVERVRDARDGRVSMVQVTPIGMAWLMESRERRDEWLAERIITLTPPQRTALVAALAAIDLLATEQP